MVTSDQLAFRTYWRIIRADKRKFWRIALSMFIAMALFESAKLLVVPLLLQQYLTRNTEAAAKVTVLFLGLVAVRGICIWYGTKTVRGIEVQGCLSLTEQIQEAIQRGMAQSCNDTLAGSATRTFMAWHTFSVVLCTSFFNSLNCLIVATVILGAERPVAVLPIIAIVGAYWLVVMLRLKQGQLLAIEAAKAQNQLANGLEWLMSVRQMRWAVERVQFNVERAKRDVAKHVSAHRQHLIRRLIAHRMTEWSVYVVMLLMLLWFCSWDESRLSTPELVGTSYLFMAFVIMLALQFQSLIAAIDSLSTAVGDAGILSRQLAQVPPVLPALPDALGSPEIEVKAAVHGITYNCRLQQGITVLKQPSGAGKSTLLNLLAGVLMPDEGSVKVCGYSPAEYDVQEWVAYVTQTPPQIGIAGIDLFPIGTPSVGDFTGLRGTQFDVPLHQLSGGQARLVYVDAAIDSCTRLGKFVLLLDEPTNGLDEQSAEMLLKRLHAVAQHHALFIVIASHDPRVWALATNPSPEW